jgi:hypothetical protein
MRKLSINLRLFTPRALGCSFLAGFFLGVPQVHKVRSFGLDVPSKRR